MQNFNDMASFGSIQALLSAPNPDDPLAENIAKHWKTNEAEAMETGECIRSHDIVVRAGPWSFGA